MRPHTLIAMLCQALYEQLRRAAVAAGRPGLELSLITGYGAMAETEVVSDLWDVSRDRLTLDEFVARHGYHGPDEGELSARVWRLRREPLMALLRSYREMGDERDPRAVERERGARARPRRGGAVRLAVALRDARRPARVAKLAARFIPLARDRQGRVPPVRRRRARRGVGARRGSSPTEACWSSPRTHSC